MGGPGAQPPAQQRGQGGSMGILMPIYTIGIVIFFLYTVMKVDIFSSTPLDIFLLSCKGSFYFFNDFAFYLDYV